jgi:hypothetical protein
VGDVSLGEDDRRVRTGSSPEVLAALRNTALQLLTGVRATSRAAAKRRFAAHPDEALHLITGQCEPGYSPDRFSNPPCTAERSLVFFARCKATLLASGPKVMPSVSPVGLFAAVAGKVRRRPEVIALALLPLVLLALNPNWAYSRLHYDPWIYFGHMTNFNGHMKAFGDLYAASRLSVVLPGAVAYKLFPPVVANHMLHLGLYYLAVGSLYFAASRTVGRRAATVISLVCGCHFFFLEAVGWDYADGFVIAYFLAATAALAAAAESGWWRFWLTVAGGFAACMVIANLTAAVLMGVLVLYFLIHNRCRQRLPLDAGGFWFAAGGVAVVLVLSVVSYKANGRFWFLASQLQFASTQKSDGLNPFHAELSTWVWNGYWLLFPAVAAISSALRLGKAAVTRTPPEWSAVAWHAGLWGLGGLLVYTQTRTSYSFLQHWFYVSMLLLPLSLLVLADCWAGWLKAISPRGCRLVAVVLGLGLIASAVWPWGSSTETWGEPAKYGVAVLATVAVVVPLLNGGRLLPAVLAVVAVAGLNGLCRHEFRIRSCFPELYRATIQIDESQAFDDRRAAVFRAVHEFTQVVRRYDKTANTWFWFDSDEPLGPVYNSAVCTHWWSRRFLNRDFPNLTALADRDPHVPTPPIDRTHPACQPGTRITVLSEDPAGDVKAVAAFAARGIGLRPLGHHIAGGPPVAFNVWVFEVLP